MYSSVNNHDKSKSILSLQELIGVIVVFAFVLYLLFPKGNIEEFLETQGSNTNLSINYLQNMILYHPDNIQLKIMLVEKYTEAGDNQKALELNHKLIENNSNKRLLTVLYKVDFLLNKIIYFDKPTDKKLTLLKKKLLAFYQFTKGERDYLFFFGESSNIDYPYLIYHSLENFMAENPDIVDYDLEKMAFDLATKLGYKEKAYAYLQKLIKYPEIEDELKAYLIYSLFERGEFSKAKEITTQLFLESQSDDELTKYFHLALYALGQDKNKGSIEVSQLIQNYANLKTLKPADIVIILNTLLELGDSKEAANFAINMFYSNPEMFDETGIDLALQSLLYNSELEQARALSFYAQNKFKKQKYLDKAILVSTWLGDIDAVSALNKEGYFKYKSSVYERYFLSHENLDYDYEVLGDIYKKKVKNKQYKYLDNLAKYYDYTGEINKAEAYFVTLSKKHRVKKALYYAIDFSHKNSHFEEGLKLYERYVTRYGIEAKLHELAITKSLAIKKFNNAYLLSKTLPKKDFMAKKQRFMDLAWIEKDYAYLYQKLWSFDRENKITANDLEHFILLEQELNHGKKLPYLYKQAWLKTHKSYHLSALMYRLLKEKKMDEFKRILNSLSPKERSIVNDNIEFQFLLANYYVENKEMHLALKSYEKILKLAANNINAQQSYLWFLLDNQEKYPNLHTKLLRHVKYLKKRPALRTKVGLVAIVAAMSVEKNRLAEYWLKKQLIIHPNNKEYRTLINDINKLKQEKLYVQYDKMLNEQYLNSQINIEQKHLSPRLNAKELSFSHQWNLYQNIKSKITLHHYRYDETGLNTQKQTAIELALKNTNKRFLWDFRVAQILAQKDFVSTSLNLGYSTNHLQINVEGKYQNKTELTPELEKNALENALALKLQLNINRRSSFGFTLQERSFTHLNGLDLGNAIQTQLNANYILRSGYPDIAFNAYVNHNQFSKNIAPDFSEFGISTGVGNIRQNTINGSWKPFGTLSLAVNDSGNFGSSLLMGISKSLKGNDSLDVLFNYYNGIGVISEPIYGINLKYRF